MPTMPERTDGIPSLAGELVPRVARLEADVSQLKVDVAEIKATLPHLATKADLAPLMQMQAQFQALIPHFATRADLASMESRLIRWMIGSWMAMAGLMTALMTALVRFAH